MLFNKCHKIFEATANVYLLAKAKHFKKKKELFTRMHVSIVVLLRAKQWCYV